MNQGGVKGVAAHEMRKERVGRNSWLELDQSVYTLDCISISTALHRLARCARQLHIELDPRFHDLYEQFPGAQSARRQQFSSVACTTPRLRFISIYFKKHPQYGRHPVTLVRKKRVIFTCLCVRPP